MADNFQYDVFVSHSTKDKVIVRDVAERLKKDGMRVWFAEWELKPGDSIPAKIEEGLERSRVLVLCMSANTFGSDWAQLESGTFRFPDPLNKDRRFIPLRLDDAPIKGSLAQFLYINWLPKGREQEYAKLLEACRSPAIWPRTQNEKDVGSLDESDRKPAATDSHEEATSTSPSSPIGDAWSGVRGLLQKAYSTRVIKGILAQAGLPIFKVKNTGTYKGPLLDETDKLVRSLDDDTRDQFVVGLIHEIVALERTNTPHPSEHGSEPDGQTVRNLQLVLARFGHNLRDFKHA
ncbi:MAG: toll/interleukin-1 receptor domain-containing protein [Planctomycetota bacterium]